MEFALLRAMLEDISLQPPHRKIRSYKQLAAQYREMSNAAYADAVKMFFNEHAERLEQLASSVVTQGDE
jgi:hypothetical protein